LNKHIFDVDYMKAYVLFFAASSLLFMGMATTQPSEEEDIVYYGYEGSLVEYSYPKPPIVDAAKSELVFPKGVTLNIMSREKMLSLFPDSTYPLPKKYKNDSMGKRVLGIATGLRRYSIREVEPIIFGRSSIQTTIVRANKKGAVTYYFDRLNEPGLGLVRLKGTNIHFIMSYK